MIKGRASRASLRRRHLSLHRHRGLHALVERAGRGAYDDALAEHRRVLRDAFARCGGVEVDTQGDAFFHAFPSAPDAIEAARDGQHALSVGAIRVRMGTAYRAPACRQRRLRRRGRAPGRADSRRAAREIGQVDGFIYALLGLAAVYATEDPTRAARLLGRTDMLLEETASSGLDPTEGRVRDEAEVDLRARLGEDAFVATYADGRVLPLDEAVALALRPD